MEDSQRREIIRRMIVRTIPVLLTIRRAIGTATTEIVGSFVTTAIISKNKLLKIHITAYNSISMMFSAQSLRLQLLSLIKITQALLYHRNILGPITTSL